MKKIPTAEDFLNDNFDAEAYSGEVFTDFAFPRIIVEKAMIEFAQLHVEAALKTASEKAMGIHCTDYVDKISILDAYPLEKLYDNTDANHFRNTLGN